VGPEAATQNRNARSRRHAPANMMLES